MAHISDDKKKLAVEKSRATRAESTKAVQAYRDSQRKRRTSEEVQAERDAKAQARADARAKRERERAERELRAKTREQARAVKAQRKHQLLPSLVRKQIAQALADAPDRGHTGHGTCVWEGSTTYRVLQVHPEKHTVLMVIRDSQTWRDGLWFSSVHGEHKVKYDPAVHQPQPGNAGIAWPEVHA